MLQSHEQMLDVVALTLCETDWDMSLEHFMRRPEDAIAQQHLHWRTANCAAQVWLFFWLRWLANLVKQKKKRPGRARISSLTKITVGRNQSTCGVWCWYEMAARCVFFLSHLRLELAKVTRRCCRWFAAHCADYHAIGSWHKNRWIQFNGARDCPMSRAARYHRKNRIGLPWKRQFALIASLPACILRIFRGSSVPPVGYLAEWWTLLADGLKLCGLLEEAARHDEVAMRSNKHKQPDFPSTDASLSTCSVLATAQLIPVDSRFRTSSHWRGCLLFALTCFVVLHSQTNLSHEGAKVLSILGVSTRNTSA